MGLGFGRREKEKFEAERAAHLETAMFDADRYDALAEKHRVAEIKHVAEVLNLKVRHEEDKRILAAHHAERERRWELEREHLRGEAAANAEKAELYNQIVLPFAWHYGGSVEINEKRYDLMQARSDLAGADFRLPFPEGKRP